MKITIQPRPTGKSFDLEVQPDIWIAELMYKVEAITGVSPWRQRLMFGGRNMTDSYQLSNFGVRHGDTIILATL